MQGSGLLQAMQAFKAALPARGLPDFQQWLRQRGPHVGVIPDSSTNDQVSPTP
jgi:hypothetical protein